jgi:hypothetical protein
MNLGGILQGEFSVQIRKFAILKQAQFRRWNAREE